MTLELAQQVVEEETGVPLADGVARDAAGDAVAESLDEAPEPRPPRSRRRPSRADEKHLIARDAKNVPLLSAFAWNGEAVERILRVPAGFMRNRTQDRIEELAAERGQRDDRPRPGRGRDRDRPRR